jgi:signal transduction histidine kinase
MAVLTKIERASQQLLSLGYDLANAHRAAAAELVNASQKSLTLLQQVIFTSLVLLMILSVWAVIIIYREMIAPMRLKLVESRLTIERQEKLASLGVLAAGVAHEIRNPLTAIKARLFILKKAVGNQSTALKDAYVIEREIGRLERIVREVLLFARPAEPKCQLISAMVLLRDVADLMRAQLEKSHITLTAAASADATIRGDPDQLKQVLLNLVRNAAESIGERGQIKLCLHIERTTLDGRLLDAPQFWKSQILEKEYLKRCKSAYSILFTPPRLRVSALDYQLQPGSLTSTTELCGTKPNWGTKPLSGSRCRSLPPLQN